MNRKIVLGAIVLASTVLAGCASNARVDALQTSVDSIASDVSAIRATVQTAADEAARANQRLDNMTKGNYRK